MKYFVMMLAIFTLSGCDSMQQNGARAGGNITRAYNDTRYKVSRYIYVEKPAPQTQAYIAPPSATFCYQAQFDVLCYDQPKPEMHLNLIAGHGEHNYAYEDFMPNNIREGNVRSDNLSISDFEDSNSTSDIMMSDLSNGGAGGAAASSFGKNSPMKSPFYYSPSPAVRDPFGDAEKIRSKYIP